MPYTKKQTRVLRARAHGRKLKKAKLNKITKKAARKMLAHA